MVGQTFRAWLLMYYSGIEKVHLRSVLHSGIEELSDERPFFCSDVLSSPLKGLEKNHHLSEIS